METARQIENLLYMYAERIDAGDYAGIAELFSRGRIVAEDGTPLATGAEEVKALYDQSTRIYPADGHPAFKTCGDKSHRGNRRRRRHSHLSVLLHSAAEDRFACLAADNHRSLPRHIR